MLDCEEFVKECQDKITENNKKRIQEHNAKIMLEIEAREKKKREQEEQCNKNTVEKFVAEKRVQNEIISPCIEQNLNARITTARWALALAMAVTLLFKGFWALWIIFIAIYVYEIRRYKREALEADIQYWERGRKK